MMRGTCNGCGKKLPPTHGYCSPCANRADGFDCGANYCDDFEGTTEAAALAFFAEFGAESLAGYVDNGGGDDDPIDAKLYGEGMLAGLKVAAKKNAELAAELAEDCA